MLLVQRSFAVSKMLMTSFKQASLSEYLANWQKYRLKFVQGIYCNDKAKVS